MDKNKIMNIIRKQINSALKQTGFYRVGKGGKPEKIPGIPTDAKQMHLYRIHNALRPRGSMRKQSLSLQVYEKLVDLFQTWTDQKYGDSLPQNEAAEIILKNLSQQIDIARRQFLRQVGLDVKGLNV